MTTGRKLFVNSGLTNRIRWTRNSTVFFSSIQIYQQKCRQTLEKKCVTMTFEYVYFRNVEQFYVNFLKKNWSFHWKSRFSCIWIECSKNQLKINLIDNFFRIILRHFMLSNQLFTEFILVVASKLELSFTKPEHKYSEMVRFDQKNSLSLH